jgi:hypothetical protein
VRAATRPVTEHGPWWSTLTETLDFHQTYHGRPCRGQPRARQLQKLSTPEPPERNAFALIGPSTGKTFLVPGGMSGQDPWRRSPARYAKSQKKKTPGHSRGVSFDARSLKNARSSSLNCRAMSVAHRRPYTPVAAKKAGIHSSRKKPLTLRRNTPVGKRFQALLLGDARRREGRRIGYVTLALDHAISAKSPTRLRHCERTVHPRRVERQLRINVGPQGPQHRSPGEYFIVGTIPRPVRRRLPGWMTRFTPCWRKSGKSYQDSSQTPRSSSSSLRRRTGPELAKDQLYGLDAVFSTSRRSAPAGAR